MRQSQLITKTKKEAPADEVSRNAQLLTRAGFVHKEMAGVYSFLPLGLRVLDKINNIIRDEMNRIGGQEVLLTVLQDPTPWEKSGRWDKSVIDIWFRTHLANGMEIGLGNTHEEPLTTILTEHILSYKDLPKYVYQIQTKFRNELRAKSGLLRGREFSMKDLYSFSRDSTEHEKFYEQAKQAYHRVFERIGIGHVTYLTFASGGSFSEFSHEFQTLCDAGEDVIYLAEEKEIAVNREVLRDDVLAKLALDKKRLVERKAIEVGNIFTLGTRFSEPLALRYVDETGQSKPVYMGCYGIGPSRAMGAVVEVHADEKGMVWPEAIAPYSIHLVSLCNKDDEIARVDELYEKMQKQGIEVLYDDRTDARAGEKFADSDLIGIPTRMIVSPKTLAAGSVEVKKRTESDSKLINITQALEIMSN